MKKSIALMSMFVLSCIAGSGRTMYSNIAPEVVVKEVKKVKRIVYVQPMFGVSASVFFN